MNRLSEATAGSRLRFISVEGGQGAKQKLAEMGLVPGEGIRILNNSGFGSVSICVKGTKLALGHGLAKKVLVREE